MNRQYSSNSSINLIAWDETIDQRNINKSNSLVEMFDPIFDSSSNHNNEENVTLEQLETSTSSDDIFASLGSKRKNIYPNLPTTDDFFTDIEIKNERISTSSIYPSLNAYKSIYSDERYSVFESPQVSEEHHASVDLRSSIFNDIFVESRCQNLFSDGYIDRDMEQVMKQVGEYHSQAVLLQQDERSHLIFDRVLSENVNRAHNNQHTRPCSISIILADSLHPSGRSSSRLSSSQSCYSVKVNPHTTSERELVLEAVEKYNITEDFFKLFLRISGASEYLRPGEFSIICYQYIFNCYRERRPVKLFLEIVDVSNKRYKADMMDDINEFVYRTLEKEFHWIPRSHLENSYNDLIIYRNMIVGNLKDYQSACVDLSTNEESINVFKDKCRSICLLCDNIYTYTMALKFVEIDSATEGLMSSYAKYDLAIISQCVKNLIGLLDETTKLMLELLYGYSRYCRTNFVIRSEQLSLLGLYHSDSGTKSIRKWGKTIFNVKLGALCRIPIDLQNFISYEARITLQVGEQRLSEFMPSKRSIIKDHRESSQACLQKIHNDFKRVVPFDQVVAFDNVSMHWLPLDTSIRICIIGRKVNNSGESSYTTSEEIGWTQVGLFDSKGVLRQGQLLLGLFPAETHEIHQWSCGTSQSKEAMIIEIKLPTFHVPIKYTFDDPKIDFIVNEQSDEVNELVNLRRAEIERQTAQIWLNGGQMDHQRQQTTQWELDHSEFMWLNRLLLDREPAWFVGLTLACCVASPQPQLESRDWLLDYLEERCSGISDNSSSVGTACLLLQLLGPRMPLSRVRRWAVQQLKKAGPDLCFSLVPLLIEALKYDVNLGGSGLEALLIDFSYKNINFATSLFWHLSSVDVHAVHGYRAVLLLGILHIVMNGAVKRMWQHQLTVVEHLQTAATAVKNFKGSGNDRKGMMLKHLEELYDLIFGLSRLDEVETHPLMTYRIPYQPGLLLTKLEVKDCSYFNSFTLPLRIVFRGHDVENVEVMFKSGDDLRQDILVLQLFRLMDELWCDSGLDLCTVHYRVMSTGTRCGLIELVTDCTTLRKIQESRGGIAAPLTNADMIACWLKGHNATQVSYMQSVRNFLLTCAASCVSTFLLGIGDRHNDNIMIQTCGRLFHIDFAKILGDAQTFVGIKRDRTPFVLTQDMVYVLRQLQPDDTEDPRTGMQLFIDKCCEAYNIIRRNWSSLAAVLTLAADSGIPGVTRTTIQFVVEKMRLDLSETEASEYFTDLIRKCVSSISNQMNFVIHNLAQMKYSTNNEGTLFSFTPKVYNHDPRILEISIRCVRKVRHPNKHYTYKIWLMREEQPHSEAVYRRYEHFMELASNMAQQFPLSCIPKLTQQINQQGSPSSLTAAETRRCVLQQFVSTILSQQDEISQCEVMHTFFHSLLSDEQAAEDSESLFLAESLTSTKSLTLKWTEPEILLKVKRGSALEIFVKHARNLPLCKTGESPNAYVKTYLYPNPGFSTKRKSTVIPKSCTPSFNDILKYDRSEIAQASYLEVSVWHSETFSENLCLGITRIGLRRHPFDEERWYKLQVSPQTQPLRSESLRNSRPSSLIYSPGYV